jgi:hypothetical protein
MNFFSSLQLGNYNNVKIVSEKITKELQSYLQNYLPTNYNTCIFFFSLCPNSPRVFGGQRAQSTTPDEPACVLSALV